MVLRLALLSIAGAVTIVAVITAVGCNASSSEPSSAPDASGPNFAPDAPVADEGGSDDGASTDALTAIPLVGCGVNYTAPVSLGDGSRTFQLIVDTGA